MIKIKLKEFKKIYNLLFENYDELEEHYKKHEEDYYWETWYNQFKNVNRYVFKKAVKNYIKFENELPTVAGLKKYMPDKDYKKRLTTID